jgi:uncharacterized protein (TIGR00645 family)
MISNNIQLIIKNTRFLIIPLYLGMSVGLLLFVIKFFQQLLHLFYVINQINEADLILEILALFDFILVANLLIMVIMSGYERFIQPLEFNKTQEKPGWLTKLDLGSIKVKVATSIIAISSIHLLSAFLNVHQHTSEHIFLLITMHLALVVSALLLAFIDRISPVREVE